KTGSDFWFSRTSDDAAHASSASIIAVSADHGAWTTLALSNTNPALPYICRLIVFRRLICPSTGPLLHRCVTAASTAASSRRIPSANRRSSGTEDASPLTSQSLRVVCALFRINAANSSARSNAAAGSSLPARLAATRASSWGVRFSGRRTQAKDSCFADGGGGTEGLLAPVRSPFFPAVPSRLVTYRHTLP